MTHRLRRSYPAVLVACCIASVPGSVDVVAHDDHEQNSTDTAAVRGVVDDYVGLYRRDRLEAWKALFIPGFTATYTNDDGSVTTRSLDDFYERQRAGFERGSMSETIDNVWIRRVGTLAQVFADFKFTSGTTTRPGHLMLLLIAVKGEWKIAALTFTYHLGQ